MSRTASPADPDRRGRSFVKREGGPDRATRTSKPTGLGGRSGDELAQLLEKLTLALRADHPPHRLPILKNDERGNAHHFEASSDVGIVVHVELGDLHLAGMLGGD